MNEVTESFVLEQRVSQTSAKRAHPTTELLEKHGLRLPSGRGHPLAPWKTTMSAADLQCLLQVIEGELIPRMIREYSPARCSPQESTFSSD